jgi:hypothetical protein
MCSGPCQSIRHPGSNRWRRLFRKRRKWSGPRNIPSNIHVSRKGAKSQRGGTVFCLAVSRRRTRIRFPCLTQRRKGGRQVRGSNHCLTQRSKGAKKTDRGERLFLGALSFVFFGLVFPLRSWRLERSGREKWFWGIGPGLTQRRKGTGMFGADSTHACRLMC